MVNQYHLDGVDIDDEYSACTPNNTSMIMLAQAIKANPEFSGKLLTKALFEDDDIFSSTYEGHTLAEYLDYGWQMSYSDANFSNRLNFYKQHGMTPAKLMIGAWTQVEYPDASSIGTYTRNNNLPGAMIYDVRKNSQGYLSQLANSEYGSERVIVSSGCLVLGK